MIHDISYIAAIASNNGCYVNLFIRSRLAYMRQVPVGKVLCYNSLY